MTIQNLFGGDIKADMHAAKQPLVHRAKVFLERQRSLTMLGSFAAAASCFIPARVAFPGAFAFAFLGTLAYDGYQTYMGRPVKKEKDVLVCAEDIIFQGREFHNDADGRPYVSGFKHRYAFTAAVAFLVSYAAHATPSEYIRVSLNEKVIESIRDGSYDPDKTMVVTVDGKNYTIQTSALPRSDLSGGIDVRGRARFCRTSFLTDQRFVEDSTEVRIDDVSGAAKPALARIKAANGARLPVFGDAPR